MEQNYTGAGNPSRRFRPYEEDGVVEVCGSPPNQAGYPC